MQWPDEGWDGWPMVGRGYPFFVGYFPPSGINGVVMGRFADMDAVADYFEDELMYEDPFGVQEGHYFIDGPC